MPTGMYGNLASKWEYLTAHEALRRAPLRTMGRLVSWRARCWLQHGAIAHLQRWDLDMYLPPNWRGVEKLIFTFRDHYEPELGYLEKILSPGMTFVDAGACYGIYSLAASRLVGLEGRVLAFEPKARAKPGSIIMRTWAVIPSAETTPSWTAEKRWPQKHSTMPSTASPSRGST